jgi:hypothetical protein
MADFFILSEEVVKLQDTTHLFPNEISVNDLEAKEIEKLLNGKAFCFENLCIKTI